MHKPNSTIQQRNWIYRELIRHTALGRPRAVCKLVKATNGGGVPLTPKQMFALQRARKKWLGKKRMWLAALVVRWWALQWSF